MQVTLFKGMMPVNLPDTWFSNPQSVRFSSTSYEQVIDFRPSGGKCLKFWLTDDNQPAWEEVENDSNIKWTDAPRHIEGRKTVKIFGQSGTVLDLTHL